MHSNATRPYTDADVPSVEEWKKLPEYIVQIEDLIPTQYYLVIDRLFALSSGEPCDGLDMPHIIGVGEKLYLHDGHHRWALAGLQGQQSIIVRIYHLPQK